MKFRTGFVTNSSSANYCVTLSVDGTAGEHAEIKIHMYNRHPWYEDTDDGCENYDRRARALSYRVNDDVDCAGSCRNARELSDSLLSAIREYGWGLSHDWWKERANWKYFYWRWVRDRLLEARAKGLEETGVDYSPYSDLFDFEEYIDELRSRGKRLEGFSPEYPPHMMENEKSEFSRSWYQDLAENTCRGWSFAIVGMPRIYASRKELESYIVEHGGTVDKPVRATTDFVIYCDDGLAQLDGNEMYWTFVVYDGLPDMEPYTPDEDLDESYEWQCYEDEGDGFCGLEDYCCSYEFDEDSFGHLFEDALGDILEKVDVSYSVIPEHEFIRRFDPQREKTGGMPYDVAHPIIAHRFAQVLESRGIAPQNLKTVTYERHISSFGDSTRLLGFYESDRGTKVEYDEDSVSWSSWGDGEDVDWAYREY